MCARAIHTHTHKKKSILKCARARESPPSSVTTTTFSPFLPVGQPFPPTANVCLNRTANRVNCARDSIIIFFFSVQFSLVCRLVAAVVLHQDGRSPRNSPCYYLTPGRACAIRRLQDNLDPAREFITIIFALCVCVFFSNVFLSVLRTSYTITRACHLNRRHLLYAPPPPQQCRRQQRAGERR